MIYLSYAIIIVSWLFIIFGMIAIFRLKNLYTRILTAATIDTVASFFLLFGLIVMTYRFEYGIRFILLIIFLLITNPISSHVNIRSAYLIGIPLDVKDGKKND
jgi:multicomponent Na+:H+ antiporter subunit G